MTIEEAIKILEPGARFNDFPHTADDVDEACRMAVASIRAQQTRAKLDRSRWEGCWSCNFQEIRELWLRNGRKYCNCCGKPLTEEAWAELEGRINGGTTD